MSDLDYPNLSFGLADEENLVRWQKDFRLDDEPIASGLDTQVEPLFADLLDLATAVYVTDRISPRRPKYKPKDGAFWRRTLRLRIAVREFDAWNDPQTKVRLLRLLGWLTDDDWQIEFLSDPTHRRISETQSRLFVDPPRRPTQVTLFSGGLDSLLGAAADAASSGGELVLVGAATHSRMKGKQLELVRGLAQVMPRTLRSVIVPVGLTKAGKMFRDDSREEESQRSRGFVFLALGAAVANAAGCKELRVHENGPGALNLPLTSAQLGSMNTRAARPETLRMMSEFLTGLTGQSFSIVNPAFLLTKAQMCEAADPRLIDLLAKSVSCDGGLTRRMSEPLCGTCTSCLLRRQALLAGGRSDVDQADQERMAGDGLSATRANAHPMVLAMLEQIRAIDGALLTPDPWASLLDLYPELGGARRAAGVDANQLVELFRHYATDWRRLDYALVREFLPPLEREPALPSAA